MAVVAEPPPAQSEGPHDPKGDQPARRALASQTPHYSSLARTALRRHQPEVGAGCPNGARPVLCGGCTVMRIPTATSTQRTRCSACSPAPSPGVTAAYGDIDEFQLPLRSDRA